MKIIALAPIEVEILLLFSLKSKRLKRPEASGAGLAPEKDYGILKIGRKKKLVSNDMKRVFYNN
ncbi:hypothetical protein ACHRVK_12085 [Flavobacterium plurextorum]|uniref:hypothetical protein n=1 Tax=Flavobacterium TaxID=237 RepID=UPI00214DF022|nr:MULTISPECIES: hypothetical protein [Flavobacterium]UUW11394.1 hypothetical protein NLG42_11430 [Flavobacterium plurextorum]